jgi:uracil-DNA glycosylase family 4
MTKKELKQFLLEELYAPYSNCTQCPLGSLGRTHVVFGRGNPDAQLMLIGEAPGRNEDLQGTPFCGQSGKLLSKLLKTAEIDENDLYITSIVKCRPPKNRQPRPNEVAICSSILLEKQIKIIAPSVICSLGACATNLLLTPGSVMSQLRGTIHKYGSITLIPAYHPAYLLRNPKGLVPLLEDLKLAHSLSISNKE